MMSLVITIIVMIILAMIFIPGSSRMPDEANYANFAEEVRNVEGKHKAIISEDRLHFTAPDGQDHDYLIGDGTLGDLVLKCAEEFYDGPDPVGRTHIREGVVVRITNRPKFCAYKHKNFAFKVISGIAAEAAANNADFTDDILAEL